MFMSQISIVTYSGSGSSNTSIFGKQNVIWDIIFYAPFQTFVIVGHQQLFDFVHFVFVLHQTKRVMDILDLFLTKYRIVFLQFFQVIIRNVDIQKTVDVFFLRIQHFRKGQKEIWIKRPIRSKQEIFANQIFLRIGVSAHVRFDNIHFLIKRRQNVNQIHGMWHKRVEYFENKRTPVFLHAYRITYLRE